MRTLYTDTHRLHHGQAELIDGHFVPCFEKPERADLVLARVRAVGLGEVLAPQAFGLEPVRRVHRSDFVDFLQTAWAQWSALGRTHDALPLVWPVPSLRSDVRPRHIDGLLGCYALDAGVPVTAGTWAAASSAADVALTAAQLVLHGDRAAFALCRPPGHHAAHAAMGGYCYLNNAAIAVQWLRDQGAARVAVLDVDYHHGNGTQQHLLRPRRHLLRLAARRPGGRVPLLHGLRRRDRCRRRPGLHLNLPLPHGTDWAGYGPALDHACQAIAGFGADLLVVSLGVDTFEQDPISRFRLRSDDYLHIGRRIARIGRPTLFVFEGGYAVDAIGVNAVNVLQGFEQA
jgi:acetoin utilization deacetylase AcuC-like enzyme